MDLGYQLVFGKNLNLPNVMIDQLPAPEEQQTVKHWLDILPFMLT